MSGDEAFDLAAAEIRADGSDLSTSIEVLAAKLETTLPDATRVTRRRRRLLGREQRVKRLEVSLGPSRYEVDVEGEAVEAWRERTVRGVVIKREPVDLAGWVAGLTQELGARSEDSAAARAALARLLG